MTPPELGLVLLSAALHAVWSVSIKSSADPLCFNLVQQWITPLALAAVAPFVDFREVPPTVWTLTVATAVIHAAYLFWMSRAYEHGDLSLVYPIARSTPAFVPLAAVPLLGESPSPGGAAGIAVVVAGIWLVHGARAWSAARLLEPAARFAFLTLAAGVAYSVVDKAAMAELAAATWSSPVPRPVLFYLLLSASHAVFFGALVVAVRGVGPLARTARSEVGRATAASLVSFASYSLILTALQTAPVSYVVATRQSSVLFVVALSVLWLRERPGRDRILGAACTVVGVALIARFS